MVKRNDERQVARSSTYKQVIVDHLWLMKEDDTLRYILGVNTVPTKQEGKMESVLVECEIILSRSVVESMKEDFDSWLKNKKEKKVKNKKETKGDK